MARTIDRRLHLVAVAAILLLAESNAFVPTPSFRPILPCQLRTTATTASTTRSQPLSLANENSGGSSGSSSSSSNNNNNNSNGKKKKKKKRYYNNKNKKKRSNTEKDQEATKERKKEIVAQAAAELRKQRQKARNPNSLPKSGATASPSTTTSAEVNKGEDNLLNIVNPFRAGQKLRETLETIATIGGGLSDEQKSMYYLDDRLQEGLSLAERNPALERESNYVPEVLVVGATGEVGRLLVQQLLLQGKVRVRVLVRDLFSKTLNLLGTGVTYCQGDLSNIESLEYAVTDVDKIIFCAGAPRRDEEDFQGKFQDYVKDTLKTTNGSKKDGGTERSSGSSGGSSGELDWDKVESELQVRSQLAEQVDLIGMQNLVRAFQNVRYADYGSSQTAKRSLFKFQSRPEDFYLFDIDDEDDGFEEEGEEEVTDRDLLDEEEGEEDESDDSILTLAEAYTADTVGEYDQVEAAAENEDDGEYTEATSRSGAQTKSQCVWMKNKFDHAVFVGKVSKGIQGLGGEAAVVSSRLRSRDDPESGIELGPGFAGFICRLCSDGGNYEAFARTGLYEKAGIEYVCEFDTVTKAKTDSNKSRNKFITKRLAFSNFKPVAKRKSNVSNGENEAVQVPPFQGNDIRQIGFRYRADSNLERQQFQRGEYSKFYLALSYIKVYRSQPEPEFMYLSDARIPPTIENGMVRHEIRQIVLPSSGGTETENTEVAVQLLDETKIKSATQTKDRSSEETYFKYRGEEILKSSGLNYAIIRVSEYNEDPSAEASTVELKPSNDEVSAVSRADVAQVCASAILDPNALNKSFYMTKSKKKASVMNENLSAQLSGLPADR